MSAATRRLLLVTVRTDSQASFTDQQWVTRCIHCRSRHVISAEGEPVTDATVEHIVPRSWFGKTAAAPLLAHLSGPDDPRNLAVACGRCNHLKGTGADARGPADPASRELVERLLELRADRFLAPSRVIGRFAPSPTGPLHIGSLVAAVASYLAAKSAGGSWLVRMEDLDLPRVVPGAADQILNALERYGLLSDSEIVYQSRRTAAYREAIDVLEAGKLVYFCGCSRSELARSASAPSPDEQEELAANVYGGTCRDGLPPGKQPRAQRFKVSPGVVRFADAVHGVVEEDVATSTGDFVVRRADGLYAYQLAVVVDDAAQGVTQVARGADLLTSTARQILLQRALDLPTPSYAHLPLIVNHDGTKLSKRDAALPVEVLDPQKVTSTLQLALRCLGLTIPKARPEVMLEEARQRFDFSRISTEQVRVSSLYG